MAARTFVVLVCSGTLLLACSSGRDDSSSPSSSAASKPTVATAPPQTASTTSVPPTVTLPADIFEPTQPAADDARAGTERARSRWDAAAFGPYDVTYRVDCSCDEATDGPVRVGVSDGTVVAAPDELADPLTVEALFDLIASAQDAGSFVRANYDDEFGYPIEVVLTSGDGQVRYEIVNVTPLTVE